MNCCAKKGEKPRPMYDRLELRRTLNGGSDWRLSDKDFLDLTQRFESFANEAHEITREGFYLMMGPLGRTYLAERMFDAMDENLDGSIQLSEFLGYYDAMINGSEDEKKRQNFDMMDIERNGLVTFEEFMEFVKQMMLMYSEQLSERVDPDNQTVRYVYEQIAGDKPEFNFDDYMTALHKDPDLFDWLEKPKAMAAQAPLSSSNKVYEKAAVDKLVNQVDKYLSYTQGVLARVLEVVASKAGPDTDVTGVDLSDLDTYEWMNANTQESDDLFLAAKKTRLGGQTIVFQKLAKGIRESLLSLDDIEIRKTHSERKAEEPTEELEGGSDSENVTERDEKLPTFFLPDSQIHQHAPREILEEHQDQLRDGINLKRGTEMQVVARSI